MYSYHILLLPISGRAAREPACFLLVRRNGVVPAVRARGEAGGRTGRESRWGRLRAGIERGAGVSFPAPKDDTQPWKRPLRALRPRQRAVPSRLASSPCFAVLLTVLLSSPDDKPSTIGQWSRRNCRPTSPPRRPKELAGTSDTGRIRPPLHHESGSVQHFLSCTRNGGSASAIRSTRLMTT